MLNVCPNAIVLLQRVVTYPGRQLDDLKIKAPDRQLRRWRNRLVEVGFAIEGPGRTLLPTDIGAHVARSRVRRMHTLPQSYRTMGLGGKAWRVAHAVAQKPVRTLFHHPMLSDVPDKTIRRARDIAWAHGLLERQQGRNYLVQPTAEAIEWFKWWECQTSAAAK